MNESDHCYNLCNGNSSSGAERSRSPLQQRPGNAPASRTCPSAASEIREDSTHHMTGSHKIKVLIGEIYPLIPVDDIFWQCDFVKLVKTCAFGRAAFRDFLKCEYSEENILFWQACEELKTENNPAIIEEKARLIYEDYISILSPKEVSLDSRVRDIINRKMVDPTPQTFDEAQSQIYTLMHRDSYPRFINSPSYKRLAHLNNNGSSSSSRKESST
ncbi:unnamed protein product, partial [Meganyctiphanes norvegica]